MSKEFLRIRETSFTVFVSNLPTKISGTEVKAMFYWAGRIVDVFFPRVWSTGDTRGFAFVRFATYGVPEIAIEMAKGKSWGGRRIQMNMVKYQTVKGGNQSTSTKGVPTRGFY